MAAAAAIVSTTVCMESAVVFARPCAATACHALLVLLRCWRPRVFSSSSFCRANRMRKAERDVLLPLGPLLVGPPHQHSVTHRSEHMRDSGVAAAAAVLCWWRQELLQPQQGLSWGTRRQIGSRDTHAHTRTHTRTDEKKVSGQRNAEEEEKTAGSQKKCIAGPTMPHQNDVTMLCSRCGWTTALPAANARERPRQPHRCHWRKPNARPPPCNRSV